MSTCIPKKDYELLKDRALKGEVSVSEISSMLPTEKAALKSIIEDFVAEKTGVSVSTGEVEAIRTKALRIDKAQKKLGDDLGNPDKLEENMEFFSSKKEMDDYLQSKAPANRIKVVTGTIGRGMMLASVKSPILNILSNTEVGITEALSRRISSVQIRGANNGLALDYVKMANKIYQKTGYDISRMTNIRDNGAGGTRVLGSDTVHAQGPGAVRKMGRVVEDVVFKQLMGAPDVAFASVHFADSVNLNAMKIAKGDRVKATELMRDAMKLEPQTPEGESLKAQGVLDAQVATWTNVTWASRVSEGIRKIFNDVSGDARVGDYLFPFVKTPANVIATGMDYAGGGIPKALFKTYKAVKSGELKSPGVMQSITRDLVRSGLGITGAAMVAGMLDDDDFVGAWDPARAQIEQLRNSNTNSFRINGKWVSADWLGPISVPVTAIMYARKYGKKGFGEMAFQYGVGTVAAVKNLPGISDIYDFVKSQSSKKNQSLEEMTGEAQDYITKEVYSRLVPSFLSDVAKATDTYDRKGGKGLEGIKAKVPGLRQTLPIKKNVLGEDMKGEPAWSDILFGSRLKTDKETAVIREVRAVSNATDKSINFTDWNKSSSKKLAQFKEKVGQEKYSKATAEYGQKLKKDLEDVTSKQKYKNSTDDEKMKIINELDAKATDVIFKKYGFKYKKKK